MNYSCKNRKPCYDDGKCYAACECNDKYKNVADQIKDMNDTQLALFLHNICENPAFHLYSVQEWYNFVTSVSEKNYE